MSSRWIRIEPSVVFFLKHVLLLLKNICIVCCSKYNGRQMYYIELWCCCCHEKIVRVWDNIGASATGVTDRDIPHRGKIELYVY